MTRLAAIIWYGHAISSNRVTALAGSRRFEHTITRSDLPGCIPAGDGGFYQNFWIDGRPYWRGVQLDEVAFPVLLAWRLWKLGALGNFDPYSMVCRACGFLIREGPVTAQDRWEEASGYSPSTLAAHIAALICACRVLRRPRRRRTRPNSCVIMQTSLNRISSVGLLRRRGTLVPGITRHYIRINPGQISRCVDEDPDCGMLILANQRPGDQFEFRREDDR